MSDTPRTDAAEITLTLMDHGIDLTYVEPDFARQLERELEAARILHNQDHEAIMALERDAARLEYMATQLCRRGEIHIDGKATMCYAWAISSARADLRDALDAALAQEPKG